MTYITIKEIKKPFGRITLEFDESINTLLLCLYNDNDKLIYTLFCDNLLHGLYFIELMKEGHFYKVV